RENHAEEVECKKGSELLFQVCWTNNSDLFLVSEAAVAVAAGFGEFSGGEAGLIEVLGLGGVGDFQGVLLQVTGEAFVGIVVGEIEALALNHLGQHGD